MTFAQVGGWIEVSESGAAFVLRIGGELDAHSRGSIEPTVMAVIASGGSVIFDLGALTFCDSQGVSMFIAADEKARAEETTLAVRHLVPPVRRVFEITNLDNVLHMID